MTVPVARGLRFEPRSIAEVDSVVMVDTRDPDRIAEIGPVVTRSGVTSSASTL